jgi:hypothetical protein
MFPASAGAAYADVLRSITLSLQLGTSPASSMAPPIRQLELSRAAKVSATFDALNSKREATSRAV